MDEPTADHARPGLSHDLPCSSCGHDHSRLPCDWCRCVSALLLGIDP